MIRDDAHWLELTDAFYSAALDGESWDPALDAFARATGSGIGELVCVGPNVVAPVNIFTNADPGIQVALDAAGGLDPNFNPRIAAGMKAPVLKSLADSDFISPDAIKSDPHYQEFLIPWDIPFICASVLERSEGLMVGIAVVRSKREGHINDAERAVFDAISPHVRAAVRMQAALEGQGDALLTGALEALSVPAFVCNAGGFVQALTPAAEQLLGADRGLTLRQGQLLAAHPADARPLKDALGIALQLQANPGAAPPDAVVMHDKAGRPSLVLDVIALPVRRLLFRFTPRVLVVARGERGADAHRAVLLQRVFALTAAEADIAIDVSQGRSPEHIAARRGVAVSTVRSQIKAIMAKLGVSRQTELAAQVNRF